MARARRSGDFRTGWWSLRSTFVTLSLVFALVFLAAVVGTAQDPGSKTPGSIVPPPDTDESRIQRGFDLSPVQLNLQGKNRASVGLGSYIVNAQAGCNDCHIEHPKRDRGVTDLTEAAIL